MSDIKKHKRVNNMLLGPLERPALQWLAARMPMWVTPDVLTGIGVVAAIMIFVGYWLTNLSPWWLWFVNLGFILNWFGDSLDGTLARSARSSVPIRLLHRPHRRCRRRVPHIFVSACRVPALDIAAFALIGYLLVSVHVYVGPPWTASSRSASRPSDPTEMRVIIMLVNTAIFFWGNPKVTLPVIGRTTASTWWGSCWRSGWGSRSSSRRAKRQSGCSRREVAPCGRSDPVSSALHSGAEPLAESRTSAYSKCLRRPVSNRCRDGYQHGCGRGRRWGLLARRPLRSRRSRPRSTYARSCHLPTSRSRAARCSRARRSREFLRGAPSGDL